MLIEVDPSRPVPQDMTAIRPGPNGSVEIDGRLSRVFVYATPELCLTTEDPQELLSELDRRELVPEIDPGAVSEFLHHGFVTAPGTIHSNIYRLSAGDVLEVRPGLNYRTRYRCPFRNALSSADELASTDRLLELLAAAVDRSIGRDPATLMLSSGKDSVALALACREAGRADVRTVTFTDGEQGEAKDAAELANRIGLEHRVVVLPDNPAVIERIVLRYFEHATEPCGDPTLIPYLLAVASMEMQSGEWLIDGLNNDSWAGYAPTAAEVRGSRISDRYLAWLRPLRGLVSPESPLSAALKTRAEWHFFGGRWLRHSDTRRFFDRSIDTHRSWQSVSRSLHELDDFDFRAEVRGRNADQNAMIVKAYVSGECFDVRASFPFTDEKLSNYYFNLPEPDRFSRATLTNKTLLRRMLREKLDYDDERLGKRVFEFDGVGFLSDHRALVEREIFDCPSWTHEVQPLVRGLLDRPQALRKTWPSLIALFQLSGWLSRRDLS